VRNPPTPRRISRLRFAIQLVSFGALIYGGFLVVGLQDAFSPTPVPEGAAASGKVKVVRQGDSATRIFLPATVCIYQRQGLCKGCSLYFVSDSITWLTPWETLLPFLLVLLGVMLLLGRIWCGWICPLGLVTDVLTKIRHGLRLEQVRLSKRWRDGLVVTKYVLLALALAIAALAALPAMSEVRSSLVDPFCRICPARIFSPFFSFDRICWTDFSDAITASFSVLGLVAFGLYFLGLFIRRFWCRLCPIAALTVLFNRTGLVSLVKEGSKCTRCGACARVCPVDIRRVYLARGREVVTDWECTLCLRCLESCPEEGCLSFQWLGGKVTGSRFHG
jgi:polyferredoxin